MRQYRTGQNRTMVQAQATATPANGDRLAFTIGTTVLLATLLALGLERLLLP